MRRVQKWQESKTLGAVLRLSNMHQIQSNIQHRIHSTKTLNGEFLQVVHNLYHLLVKYKQSMVQVLFIETIQTLSLIYKLVE